MHVSATAHPRIVKALRVLLVFSLVFWTSFRIEMLAFADDENDSNPPAAESQTGETVSDGTDNQGENQGTKPDDSQSGTETPSQGEDAGNGGGGEGAGGDAGESGQVTPEVPASTLKNLEVHLLNSNPPENSTDPLKHVGALVRDSATQSPQVNAPKIDAVQGELAFVPVVEKTDNSRIDASNLVEWSVEDKYLEFADFVEKDGKKTNVLKAKGEKDSEIIAVCKLKKEAYSQFNLDENTPVEVRFRVDVTEQAGSYITAIELLDKDGMALAGNSTLKLDLDEGSSLSYQFGVRVKVVDPSSTAKEREYTLDPSNAEGLSDHDKMLLESLTWSVSNSEGASIDNTGLFKASEKLETTVICASGKGVGGSSVSMSLTVNTGVVGDVQGASHPQDTLLVIAPSDVVKTADAANDGSEESADAPVEGADSGADAVTAAAEEGDSEGKPAGTSDGGETPEAAKPESVNKAYSLEDLSSLGWSTATYVLQGSTAGASGETANTTTITGVGPNLASILEDAGVDLTKVRSVTFVNYLGEAQTLPWSSLGDNGSTAMLAAKSLVHTEGKSAPASEADLLENTRFRLLASDGAPLQSALSWVNTIRVNGDGDGDGGSGSTDSSLRAHIFYNPVPIGYTAVLTAAMTGLYESEQFGYEWQMSTDGGATWSETVDTAQTIRVPTSETTIGRQYRVIATTNAGRTDTSDPETIREPGANEFSVTLAYDPPLAGEMAFFTSSVSGIDPADITDYIWEWTEDDGQTWQEIAGSRGNPTFSAMTDPVESSDGETTDEKSDAADEGDEATSGDSADPEEEIDRTPAPSMWIHVRVLATGGREAVSNPVMLTVHVTEDPGSGQEPLPDIPEDPSDNPSAPGSDYPVIAPDPEEEPTVETGPVMQEITSITTETAPRSESTSEVVTSEPAATEQRPDGTQSTPTPESARSDAPTDIIVNPTITAEILEQREAVNEAVQATRPGARWTALTTVEPDGKDVQRILSENPFVPLTAPFALGITAAGFVEKLLGFRRQIR
ncbi:MAG: Ig-like domain-containing protein [Eggerthellaceae bacterium]|nr:Ig-like domain-containing protein [Eggerthellaceae bacterium]